MTDDIWSDFISFVTSNEDSQDIVKWLSRTGYPLEMKVSRSFHQHTSLFPENGGFYVDPIKREVRETDVVVHNSLNMGDVREGLRLALWVRFVIECKSKPAPWVVLTDREDSLSSYYAFARLDFTPTSGVDEAGFGEIPPTLLPGTVGYGICEKRTGDKSNDKRRPDAAYSAIRQAASAAIGINEEYANTKHNRSTQYPQIVLPVVVTDGLLYEAWLDRQGDLHARSVARSQVVVRVSEEHMPCIVQIVTAADIDNFATDCEEMVDYLTRARGSEEH